MNIKMEKQLKSAKSTGFLNISNQGLSEFPEDIFKMYELQFENHNWWEDIELKKIDFSNNNITNIDNRISYFKDIEIIRGKHNKLTTINNELFNCINLKLIDLEYNNIKLSNINNIINCANISCLNLNHNIINEIPLQIYQLYNIQELYLNHNNITSINEKINNLKNLKILDLSFNKIKEINFSINLESLENLDISNNNISVIHDELLLHLNGVKIIKLTNNKITKIINFPNSLALEQVFINNNNLKLFKNIINSSNIKTLDLKDNKLNELPNDFFGLQYISTLDISNNDFKNLPNELGLMKSLIKIYIEGNMIKSIRKDIIDKGTNYLKEYLKNRIDVNSMPDNKEIPESKSKLIENELLKNLKNNKINYFDYLNNKTLSLKGLNISELDIEIFDKFKNIEVLELDNNNFELYPNNIFKFEDLNTLSLNNNNIKGAINYNTNNVKNLFISKNKIIDFLIINPINVCLTVLDISINNLEHIPKCFEDMESLVSLNISYNRINSIDNFINKITNNKNNLVNLNISNNKINNIPINIIYLFNLKTLNIENNNIKHIYEGIGLMKLTNLSIIGNISAINKNINLCSSTPTLLNYLKGRITNEHELLENMKKKYNSIYNKEKIVTNNNISNKAEEINTKKVTERINYINNELQNNFQLNNLKIMNYKKELNILKAKLKE